jgi:SM-20-related protein
MKKQSKIAVKPVKKIKKVNKPILDLKKLNNIKLVTEPYDYVMVPNFINGSALKKILKDYPVIKSGGSFPLSELKYGPAFANLITTLNGEDFRKAVEEKFSLDLKNRPTIFTVRGKCRKRDGKIHTDTESKIITVLLYMNPDWEKDGGRLRVLKSQNIEDVAAEIPPVNGTLLLFKRSDHSFHGHKSFSGDRKVIQMNWVTEEKFVRSNLLRHKFSAIFKKLAVFGGGY